VTTPKLGPLNDPAFREQLNWWIIKVGLASQVQTLRGKKNWTQGELADAVGVSTGTITKLENPLSTYVPSISLLLKIAKACDVSLQVRFEAWSKLLEAERIRHQAHPILRTFNEEFPDAP
jgi:transcriptional regulator with XRE-family HTH domain